MISIVKDNDHLLLLTSKSRKFRFSKSFSFYLPISSNMRRINNKKFSVELVQKQHTLGFKLQCAMQLYNNVVLSYRRHLAWLINDLQDDECDDFASSISIKVKKLEAYSNKAEEKSYRHPSTNAGNYLLNPKQIKCG